MCMNATVSMRCMSPALTKSSVIRHFDIGGTLEIYHKIIPGFYMRLLHLIFVDPDTNQYKDPAKWNGRCTHPCALAGIIAVLNMPNIQYPPPPLFCHMTLCCDYVKIALVALSGICAWMKQCL